MTYFLLGLLVLDALLLTTVVLLQSGKGGGLAAMGGGGGGSDTLFGTRQAATLLTRATWWTGGIFLALALVLSSISGRPTAPESILGGGVAPVAPVRTAPALPGVVQPAPAAAPETGTPAPATEPVTPVLPAP